MTTLNRKVAPAIHPAAHIGFEFPEPIKLGKELSVYALHDPACEVVRIELQFEAGTRFADINLQASLANDLITAGTSRYSAAQIASRIDFYGAYFEKNAGHQFGSLVIYSLKKFAGDVLRFIAEVIREANYPEDELQTAVQIRRQRFLINQQKVGHVARRELLAALYGKDHIFGRSTELEQYDQILQQDVLDFHRHYYGGNLEIFISGHVDETLMKTVEEEFGEYATGHAKVPAIADPKPSGEVRQVFPKAGAVQSALRMGRVLFDRRHEDFTGMQVLTTVLGGYFGSRLMSNLREDKGYTYGVGAGISTFIEGGYFFISTEVGAQVTKKAEEEIHRELNRLLLEPVQEGELNTVRSYMLGQVLRSIDGAFSSMDRFKGFHKYGLTSRDFDRWIDELKSVRPERIQALAEKWLKPEYLMTVIAGSDE